ncbi:MAG: hypothetical protein AAGA70_11765, partial [Pseudomonadota bacterium]
KDAGHPAYRGFVSLGWRADDPANPTASGSLLSATWADSGDEHRLVTLLGVSAPTEAHRLDPGAYYGLRRPLGTHPGSGTHVWLPYSRLRQEPDWPPHSHNSDLFSLLLIGEIENHEWNWQSNPMSKEVLYEVGYQENRSMILKTDEFGRTTDLSITKFEQGQSYYVPKGQFHASEVASDQTAVTLVLLSETKVGNSIVVGSRDGASSYTFDRNAVDPEQHVKARQAALKGINDLLQ